MIQHQLLEFITRHWFLSLLFFIALAAVIVYELRMRSGNNTLSVQDAVFYINKEKAVVIDTREAAAFQKGHIVNAVNFPAEHIQEQVKKLNKYKSKPLLLCDDNGQQVPTIRLQLLKQGFEKVKSLSGGIAAWHEAKFPLAEGK